jgi:hypothetical protein
MDCVISCRLKANNMNHQQALVNGKPLEGLLELIMKRDGKLTREFTFKLLREARSTTLTIKPKKAA